MAYDLATKQPIATVDFPFHELDPEEPESTETGNLAELFQAGLIFVTDPKVRRDARPARWAAFSHLWRVPGYMTPAEAAHSGGVSLRSFMRSLAQMKAQLNVTVGSCKFPKKNKGIARVETH